MDRNIRRENFGSTAGCDRLLQQLHHEFSRQSDRSRRQHAQHPHHAENTILSETAGNPQNTHWRNNLMLGQNSNATIFSVTTNTNYTSSDYNGFRLNPGAQVSFRWNSPPFNVAIDPLGPGLRPILKLAIMKVGLSTVRRPDRIGTAFSWTTTFS